MLPSEMKEIDSSKSECESSYFGCPLLALPARERGDGKETSSVEGPFVMRLQTGFRKLSEGGQNASGDKACEFHNSSPPGTEAGNQWTGLRVLTAGATVRIYHQSSPV